VPGEPPGEPGLPLELGGDDWLGDDGGDDEGDVSLVVAQPPATVAQASASTIRSETKPRIAVFSVDGARPA
jgi:hypothetical protein